MNRNIDPSKMFDRKARRNEKARQRYASLTEEQKEIQRKKRRDTYKSKKEKTKTTFTSSLVLRGKGIALYILHYSEYLDAHLPL